MTAVKQINIKIKSELQIFDRNINCSQGYNSWDFTTSLLVFFGCLMHSLYNVSPSLSLKQLTVEQEFKNISSCKICNFPLHLTATAITLYRRTFCPCLYICLVLILLLTNV